MGTKGDSPVSSSTSLRAILQRATERDLYDAARYAIQGFDQELVRLLVAGKLWNDRQALDSGGTLRTLERGRREWPDLDRRIERSVGRSGFGSPRMLPVGSRSFAT